MLQIVLVEMGSIDPYFNGIGPILYYVHDSGSLVCPTYSDSIEKDLLCKVCIFLANTVYILYRNFYFHYFASLVSIKFEFRCKGAETWFSLLPLARIQTVCRPVNP